MKTRISAIVLAAVLLIMSVSSALPAFAVGMYAVKGEAPLPKYNTPAGYNDHDYQKLVAFLETEDENGVKNGEKLFESYDPEDPTTWTDSSWHWIYWLEGRVSDIRLAFIEELVGRLDVSGCTELEELSCGYNRITELDVSGCTKLQYLYCYNNELSELDVSGCTALVNLSCYENALTELDVSGLTTLLDLHCSRNALTELNISGCTCLADIKCEENALTELDFSSCPNISFVYCSNNALTELDVSGSADLFWLYCENNELTSLNVSDCPWLENLCCRGNALTEIDLSTNPNMPFDYIKAEGDGTVGCVSSPQKDGEECYSHAIAEPKEGRDFLGWYSEGGEFVSDQLWLGQDATDVTRLIARFEHVDIVPGDLTGDGAVSANDALLALRASMNLLTLTEDQLAAVDVNHNGYLDATDALMILRAAMGLITL